VGGGFAGFGAVERHYLAELDLSTGVPTSWDPNLDNIPLCVAVGPSAVYAGGGFRAVGTSAQAYFAGFTGVSTAVALATQTAESDARGIRVVWHASGDAIVSTSVYRRTETTDWVLQGHPEPDATHRILFEDTSVTPGTRYGYRLVVRDVQGAENSAEAWVTAADEVGAPRVMSLAPVHPNPFGGSGQLTYGIPQSGRVRLSIYDLQGRLVATVVDRTEAAGWRTAMWDGRDRSGHTVASGAYFARLEMNGKVDVRKIVVAR
jgi:hypothetical protein